MIELHCWRSNRIRCVAASCLIKESTVLRLDGAAAAVLHLREEEEEEGGRGSGHGLYERITAESKVHFSLRNQFSELKTTHRCPMRIMKYLRSLCQYKIRIQPDLTRSSSM